MAVINRQTSALLVIPFGLFVIYILEYNSPSPNLTRGKTKEQKYLLYNKDEIFKNLIAAEGHFRNVEMRDTPDRDGFLNCVVKHLADAEGHADEAISHSAVVEGATESEQFQSLRDGIRDLRRDVQEAEVAPPQGIIRIREIRRAFESFNPDYDISKCESCLIVV